MSTTHSRPGGSLPWNYPYQPMGSARPPNGHDYYIDGYGNAPRGADPGLPSIPPPFRAPHERLDPATALHNHGFSESISPIASSSHLPGPGLKPRRTSLDSATAMRKPWPATSRLGLDPVAKQERRREQNRLAQRAFRARAKVREQGHVSPL